MACPAWFRPTGLPPSSHAANRSSDTCQALIDAANDAGGPDNITVAMLKVDVA